MIVLFILAALVALAGWRWEIERRERAETELREANVSWEMLHDAMVARAERWQGRAVDAECKLIQPLDPPRGADGRSTKRVDTLRLRGSVEARPQK